MSYLEKIDEIKVLEELKKYQTKTNMIEAKAALDGFPKKCFDTISSFANKYGSIILFGVNEQNNFSFNGVYVLNDLQKQVSALCSDALEQAIRPDILPFEYDGKKLLAVKIDEIAQNQKPCYYKPMGLISVRIQELAIVMNQ